MPETPPLPAGYTLDQTAAPPPLPPGYMLDSGQQATDQETHADFNTPLDETIPLSSYGNATMSGLQSAGRAIRDTVKAGIDASIPKNGVEGVVSALLPGVGLPTYKMAKGLLQTGKQATQIPATLHEINEGTDPVGTYAKVAQETAAQGGVQALAAAATEGATRLVPKIGSVIPSAERAGAALEDVKSTAGNVEINTAKPGNTALEIYTQSQRGANLPPSVGKLVRRLTNPDSPPMTYAEAKDFQSNISKLSADEKMRLNPNTKRLVGQLNADLKSSLEEAADTVGKGQQFAQAMKEYHHAMQIRGMTDAAIDASWKAALSAGGLYGLNKIIQAGLSGKTGN